ncbi:glutamine-rich protein 2 isoform X2 [Cyclopterus lumpus]|uniref:glutamine-rich protein 2 isoform X2 n=1 Tax=Cyclopterus lumpus TaxID=8103 RepID=UPI0014872437|nr:glutamine-rich protein 2 isoform X2 [Cyclopterus lumpus]
MSEEMVSLFELLNLAIGTPQKGAVNFSALHALLHAVLRQLDVQETPWSDGPGGGEEEGGEEQRTPGQRDVSPGQQQPQEPGPAASSSIPTREDGVAQEEMKEEIKEEMKEFYHQQQVAAEPSSDVEQCCHRVDALEQSVRSLTDALQRCPDPEELSRCVTWDALEATLLCCRERVPKVMGDQLPHAVQDASRPAAPTGSGLVSMENGSPMQTGPTTGLPAAGVSARYSETLEALRALGQLEARVAPLEEEGKAEQSRMDRLTERIANKSSRDASSALMDQLDQQRALIDGLLSDRDKRDGPEGMKRTSPDQECRSGAPGSRESDSRASQELRQQVSSLRKSVKKLEDDVKQLKATQERTSDGDLQDQLDDLRPVLEDTMRSVTSQLSERPDLDNEGAVHTGEKLSQLYEHYEQLQDTVSSLPEQQSGGPAGLPDPENQELVDGVQKAILQLQAECEKLHETTRSLTDDSRERRSHIEELFKMTEDLEEKKADKQLVESGIQAEKSALESKVSRLQFDSVTEQLNAMFHELLSRVTGQEQDWSKVIDRLSTEMERKLNRMELDSVKKQLEHRWKNIQQKLQAQGAPEQEDAAGIRKQLVDRFHCLSCDRPVVMHAHGPHLVKLPSSPGFPSHKSIRPFTVYALEQFRQHYRSLKPGTSHLNYEVAIRRREQLQRSHAVMCRQIESTQRTPRPGDQPARADLVQNQNQIQTRTLHDRVSEGTDYGHLAVPRSCGGIHTVTSQRRPMKHHAQVEGDPGVQSEEVDIFGLDGHIYKGRLNAPARNTETKLPTISTKDGKTKDKAKCSLLYKPNTSPEVHHTLSGKSVQSSRSASSSSGRDWPVSALGSVTPASAAAEPQDL